MNDQGKVVIRKLPSGVPGLDEILGGGLPEFSFNIVAGAPGCGKTTLAHQFIFANATPERPALYFTVLGEPALKMLRYQQQFTFFDVEKMGTAVRFIHLSEVLSERGLEGVLHEITKAVEGSNASIVVVDSFRTVLHGEDGGGLKLPVFLQRLALFLATWEATTFLVGEYPVTEMLHDPIFTVADGLFWLFQDVDRNSVIRKLQIMKLRGQASVPGLHTFRITEDGVQAFSRTLGLTPKRPEVANKLLLSTGIKTLDEMLGGGIPEGDSLLLSGSAGTGKSLIATQFIDAGLKAGEPGIVAVFEERPEEYADRAAKFGMDLKSSLQGGKLEVLYLRPLDLSVDEMMQEVLDAVKRTGAKRLVIDSLAGFEMALAPPFRTEFRESLYRMIFALTGIGITIVSTLEMEETFTEFRFSTYAISFLTDDVVRLRYVEIDGELQKIITVVKMRGARHSKEIRGYDIDEDGIVIGPRLSGYRNLLTGLPERVQSAPESAAFLTRNDDGSKPTS